MVEVNPEILQRDLIQARLLSAVFNRAVKNEVVLKGGMAIESWLAPSADAAADVHHQP